ncbi:MAG: hypothetical protein RMJ86_02880 [Anaerolineae bacterium]|nr:hypothetical protein [Thermoflexales bacterium]MDW8053477.1 hypothetical protein [Anaerolineae bacterium]MDW8293205.1 hypothetical protein [Anaerolineae bacterium]
MTSSSKVTTLPDLRVLPLTALVPHEHTDPRRIAPLVERLRVEQVLRNPPIVAPLDSASSRFVVLDGANRVAALMALGVPHVVAQVVDYADVELHVWHHALTRCDAEALLRDLRAIEDLSMEPSDLLAARAALARREALAFIMLDVGESALCCMLLSGGHNLRARTDLLNRVVSLYEGCTHVQRTPSDDLNEVKRTFPDAAALVVFPRYAPAEVIDLARSGVRLPAGITRHVLPLRALRLNYPLEVLRSTEPLARKQAHLTEWIFERVAQRRVRTYTEPTVLFDE